MSFSEQPPVKKRIAEIKTQMNLIRTENGESKKLLDLTQKELKVLESKLQDPFNVIKEYFALATKTLNSNYEKDCVLYEEQVSFLQEQIHQMSDDKVKATQSCLILEQKMRNLAQDVGL